MILAIFTPCLPVLAQKDTTVLLREVIVSGLRNDDIRRTSLNIAILKTDGQDGRSAFNLSDALAQTPGISQMTTGFAISKPVIRGLYGNRILVLLSGLRFDNQQFQDEHGLGISTLGIQRTEIIKGPASILYGTDAIGGVINIVEEQVDPSIYRKLDFGTKFYSNTLGTVTDLGYQRNKGNRWFRIRSGYESHADYSNGNNKRVLNSRANGYYLKAGWGAHRKNRESENSYNLSYNNFGFITEDLGDIFQGDNRWSRKMNGPHHIVALNLFNSKNSYTLNTSSLQTNWGIQSNLRLEDEAGGQISLNMHLLSGLANVKWEKPLSNSLMLITNGQLSLESNKNYGSRIIIPDAATLEINGSAFLRRSVANSVLELGAGIGDKSIKTYATKDLNSPDKEVHPFTIHRPSFNTLAGISVLPTGHLTFKANLGTGYRAPNLAELSSDGLHEGTSRYEIGDPGLGIEHNVNTDISAEWQNSFLLLYGSVYYNKIYNYIYLAPTSENYFGFPIYRYLQHDAQLWGGEAILQIYPLNNKEFQIRNSAALTRGQLGNVGNLPFIPPVKWTSSLRFERQFGSKQIKWFAEPEMVWVGAQNNVAQFETSTGAYHLFNFYMGLVIPKNDSKITISLSAQNMLNTAYVDHLSRLKYYGILNPGRNFTLQVRFPIFTKNLSQN